MKTPFYRGSRSPLNFPLFPSNCQRRWSETAAVQSASLEDAENQARRWSMPWENKTDKQSTRVPVSRLTSSTNKPSCGSTPASSVDGLTEAIQLLSCKPIQKPTTTVQHSIGVPFIEEPQTSLQQQGMYGIWQNASSQPIYYLKQMKEQRKSFDENAPP